MATAGGRGRRAAETPMEAVARGGDRPIGGLGRPDANGAMGWGIGGRSRPPRAWAGPPWLAGRLGGWASG